jgi:Sulfotransferase family
MVAQLDRTFLRIAPGRAASRLIGYSFFEGRPVTTAGRWWNPVVFGNLRLAANRVGKRVDRPVFIVGMGRSGTTLLGQILAAHPSVGFLNEPKAMWHVIRDDEDIIGSYAPPRTGRLYLGAEDANKEVSRRSRALFTWYLRASRSKRLVDKYPELIFRHAFVRALFPDARFLIAVRSPWSTLKSVAGWSESHATESANWWGVRDQKWDILWTQGVLHMPSNSDLVTLDLADESNHYIRAAVEWIVTMREAISLAAVDPCAQIIRYEELVRHSRDLIRNTLRFCELPASSRTEAYAYATVSTQESKGGDRHAYSSLLPEKLADAIDKTWSRLDAIDQAP